MSAFGKKGIEWDQTNVKDTVEIVFLNKGQDQALQITGGKFQES